MELKDLAEFIKKACQDFPVLVALIVLAVCISIFIMIDAHRHKKQRPRHRGKHHDR